MQTRRTPPTGLLVLGISVIGWLTVHACQICIPFPKKSAAERLIESETVVLARENPDRPFFFKTVEMLKGDPADAAEIDLFLNSTVRRILAAHPERSVVLAKKAGGDGWKSLGMTDDDYGPLVREILKASSGWKTEPKRRVAFFAKCLGSESDLVRTLAHLEIAKAPYSEIRRLREALPRDEIRAFLGNMRYIEWHALYILLLAQSDDARDREFIAESFRSAEKFGLLNRLGAWATASIELKEADAIEFIEDHYFRNAVREGEELQEVIRALSVHGANGHTHLRDRIVAAYGVLLENHPSMAPRVVRDLTAWKRSELAEPLARIAAARPPILDFQETLRLRAYLRKAKGTK